MKTFNQFQEDMSKLPGLGGGGGEAPTQLVQYLKANLLKKE